MTVGKNGDIMDLNTIIKAIEKDYPDAHSFTKREMLKELRRIQALPDKWRKEALFGATINPNYDNLNHCANELEDKIVGYKKP